MDVSAIGGPAHVFQRRMVATKQVILQTRRSHGQVACCLRAMTDASSPQPFERMSSSQHSVHKHTFASNFPFRVVQENTTSWAHADCYVRSLGCKAFKLYRANQPQPVQPQPVDACGKQ